MIQRPLASKGNQTEGPASKFEFLKLLSQGYLAKVWLVREKATQQSFVLKAVNKQRLLATRAQDQLYIERLVLQQRLAPHVTELYSSFQDAQNLYFQLEFVENGNLASYLQKNKEKLREGQRREMVLQVINLLQSCHERGIIHGDLKAENVLVAADGTLKLADFGSAKVVHLPGKNDALYQKYSSIVANSRGSESTAGEEQQYIGVVGSSGQSEATVREEQLHQKMIRLGQLKGTLHYLSPEAIEGDQYDFSNDLWALGILVHKIFSERYPFDGSCENDILAAIECRLPAIDDCLPGDIQELVEGLLRPVKKERLGCKQSSLAANYEELKASCALDCNRPGIEELGTRTSLIESAEKLVLQKGSVSVGGGNYPEVTARAQLPKWLFWKENVVLRMGSTTIRVTREEDEEVLREFPINGVLRAASSGKGTLCIQSGSQRFSCRLVGEEPETWVNMIHSATRL